MVIEKQLDNILDTKSKVKIIRLFASRTEGFMASGREIAKLVGLTPPAAHASLKELLNQDILKREIIGKQHIYRLNYSNRTVKEILQPAFQKERLILDDIGDFLLKKIKEHKIKNLILSLILYGSIAKGSTHEKSDCDIAIVAKDSPAAKMIGDIFLEKISGKFIEYFGIRLDTYTKTQTEFARRLKKNLAPVSTLIKSYKVIYGKDPLDYK